MLLVFYSILCSVNIYNQIEKRKKYKCQFAAILREAAKKNSTTSGPMTKRCVCVWWGGGVKAGPLRKKNFFWALKTKHYKENPRAIKLEALVVGPLLKELFLRLP